MKPAFRVAVDQQIPGRIIGDLPFSDSSGGDTADLVDPRLRQLYHRLKPGEILLREIVLNPNRSCIGNAHRPRKPGVLIFSVDTFAAFQNEMNLTAFRNTGNIELAEEFFSRQNFRHR